jgi:hypothetical protein
VTHPGDTQGCVWCARDTSGAVEQQAMFIRHAQASGGGGGGRTSAAAEEDKEGGYGQQQ